MTSLCFLEDDAPLSDEDHLFDDLRQAIREIRADWYSLAIELGIDYGTRKVRLVTVLWCIEICKILPHTGH